MENSKPFHTMNREESFMDGFKPERKEREEDQPVVPPARKPYIKPAFQYERVFETMALHCGKITTHQKHCKPTKS